MTCYKSMRTLAPVALAAVFFSAAAPNAWAQDEEEPALTVGEILIQLNDTDGDLGFHARIDGDPWEKLEIENPYGKKIFNIRNRRSLKTQGLTEFAFESAEPQFDELDPEEFFDRFPEGEYEISAKSTEGTEMERIAVYTHVIPAAPLIISPYPAPDCDEATPVALGPVTLVWDAVTTSHPDLGRNDPAIEITHYVVSVEREAPEPVLQLDISLPADATSFAIPDDFLALGTLFKFQVLVGEASGNETSAEGCFEFQE